MFDAAIERLTRTVAERFSRRSFLGRVGKAAVLVGSGPVVATVLADPVRAHHECGHIAFSPSCPTYECADGVWGWCWFASGCCTDGAIKKVCDCCVWRYPNVHGYCPSGYNVKCLVTSCANDPRAPEVAAARLASGDPAELAALVARIKYPGTHPRAVLTQAETVPSAALAASVAKLLDAPLLRTGRDELAPVTAAELSRLLTGEVLIVTDELSPAVDADLVGRGLGVQRVGKSRRADELAGQVLEWLGTEGIAVPGVVLVATASGSGRGVPLAAAGACARGYLCAPVGGLDVHSELASRLAGTTLLFGAEVQPLAPVVPGAMSLTGDSLDDVVATDLRQHAVSGTARVLTAMPENSNIAVSLAALGFPAFVTGPDGPIGAAAALLDELKPALDLVYAGGGESDLGSHGYARLQALLGGYRWDLYEGNIPYRFIPPSGPN